MKATRGIGIPPAGVAPHAHASYPRSVAPCVAVKTPPLRLGQAPGDLQELELALAASQHEWTSARQQVAFLREENALLRQIAVQREQEVAKVRHFAYHDELTGLPNRALLLDRLKQALVRAKRQRTHLALLFLDLDGFKAINDRFGHDAGDKLLQRIAERLLSCIRGGDTACRYGGDEFVLLLPEVDDEKCAMDIAQKIRVRVAKPYMVDGYSIAMTASIGVAVYPIDGLSENELIKRADVAMYLAKTIAVPERHAPD